MISVLMTYDSCLIINTLQLSVRKTWIQYSKEYWIIEQKLKHEEQKEERGREEKRERERERDGEYVCEREIERKIKCVF